MTNHNLKDLIITYHLDSFNSYNFGCRVNSAEVNQLRQLFLNLGLVPEEDNPDLYLVNTCAVTKKGESESLSKIRSLLRHQPRAYILATGCAQLDKISHPRLISLSNQHKEELLEQLRGHYSPETQDRLSHDQRFLLKVQSGCTFTCSYCIVPQRRSRLWSLPIDQAVETVNRAIADGHQEVIITGVNLIQYQPVLSQLLEALLSKTTVPLLSFGSLPLNCVDSHFLNLISTHQARISLFLHIPIQSGSDKILKLMHRHYDRQKIITTFQKLRDSRPQLRFGTDIIVGFPTESESDFQETSDLCQQIGFTKIHTFRYSPRPNTEARQLFESSPKIINSDKLNRSRRIRSLVL